MANKVRFGLEKAYYALITEEGYGTPKAWPGAVSLTLEASGESSTFHADNTAYATFTTNAGYTGEINMAALEDEVRVDLLGDVKDANGAIYEVHDAQPASFALLFEVKGNVNDQRFAMYECTLSRPGEEHNTTTDSTEPDTVTLPFTAIPHEMQVGTATKKVTRCCIENTEAGKASFDSWYEEVYVPTDAAA